MKNKIERPDKYSAKTTLNSADKMIQRLYFIYGSRKIITDNIIHGEDKSFKHEVLKELEKLDVDTLNAAKQGIRVSMLKKAGINNLSQLYGMTLHRITKIEGIGDQTAVKIKKLVDDAYRAIRSSISIHINPDSRNPAQDELLKNLYMLKNGKALFLKAKELIDSEPNAYPIMKEASAASSTLKWFFSSKRKKEASLKAYEHILSVINGDFSYEFHNIDTEYNKLFNPDSETVYKDFEQSSVAYYTLLESLNIAPTKRTVTGLPEELVLEIEQYPINLSHMKASLRNYQIFGAKYVLHQEKALLGDEMGLGKTIQALAVIADLKAQGKTHFMVVCPASVLVNWQREVEKHTDISSIIIHGFDKEEEFLIWKEDGGIGITNFETITKLAEKIDFPPAILVVDEAHFVKNPVAQRTKSLISVAEKTDYILYMTGTPLENRVDEMCFLIGCLNPNIASKITKMKTLSSTDKFKTEIAPVYLRRLRNDVLKELPDLIESEDWLEANKEEQQEYYKSVRTGNFMGMRRISWDVDILNSTKAKRLLEICDDAQDSGRKIIVFSFFLNTLNKVVEMFGDRAVGPITGGVSTTVRQQMIDEFSSSEPGKVLVAQVQAGGVGLNIQAASVVVFCEPQIKPSLESQAISRAYRMGQVRDVQVHRLLCEKTIDEGMMKMLSSKQLEFDTYADESVAGTASLKHEADNAWINEIVKQEQEKLDKLT